jgi:hypothetical protein
VQRLCWASPPFSDRQPGCPPRQSGVSVRLGRALQGSLFNQLTSPGGGENRPRDDVLKRGNSDLFADRGTDLERVRETFFVPASGMAGSRHLEGCGGKITRGQR